MPEYFTPQEVALALRVHINTVYRYLEEGQFPNVRRLKRSYRITQADVEEFMARRVPPAPHPHPTSGRRIVSSGLT